MGDFAWYDHVLATSLLVGAIPERHQTADGSVDLDTLLVLVVAAHQQVVHVQPAEMTKWFNTNYDYIVPELLAVISSFN